jgi:D-alanyl-D-alanine carboxypeptidase/D-alanyl-D-alanine-endopeptidase (penicillin-binding protein 4)
MLSLVLPVLTLLIAPPDGLEQPLQRGELKGARVAVCVVDVATGQRIFARSADAPMAPASNMKLVTTAASLSLLGADFSFSTGVCATARPDAQGVLTGDIIIVGGGDPCLREDLFSDPQGREPARVLADFITAAGIRHVDGRLLLDDGLFDRQWLNPDWKAGDIGNDYAAPIGALSIHGNCLALEVNGAGATAAITTIVDGFRIRDELGKAASAKAYEVGALRPDADGFVCVQGRIGSAVGPQAVRVPVIDPAGYFGACVLGELRRSGVEVTSGLEVEAGAGGRATERLGALTSPLVNAVLVANKESDNGLADHLFKNLGARKGGEGSFAGGQRAVLDWLQHGVGTSVEGVVLRDGSGLSSNDRVTARLLTDVLVSMARRGDAAGAAFLRSLPVAGLDGSLRDRMHDPPLQGAVRAKTGYIAGVSCLSGFARTQSGRTLAFSVLINGFDERFSNSSMKAIEDDFCRALVTQS